MGKCQLCGKKAITSIDVKSQEGKYLFDLEICKKCFENSKNNGIPTAINKHWKFK